MPRKPRQLLDHGCYHVIAPLVDEDPYYGQLGADPYRRQEAYRDFVRLESPYAPMLDAELIERPF